MPGPRMADLPRPADAKFGAPPPWATVPADRRRHVTSAQVEAALAAFPPDPRQMPAPAAAQAPQLKASAVLCALVDDAAGQARVVLTVRSNRLRNHRGEISFPGGRIDPGETVEEAALREAHEEVDLQPGHTRLVGRLPGLWTFVSSSLITPVVGLVNGQPELTPNPDEVDEVFTTPLAALYGDGAYHQELWNMRGLEDRDMHFFALPEGVVWGATARMLQSLGTVLTRAWTAEVI